MVRVQGQTRYQEATGRCTHLDALVPTRGQRAKGAGRVCKKRGWHSASVVVYWGPRHATPFALVSDLPAQWALLALYRKRSPIEATCRDYKLHGWQWEQGQVTVLAHVEPLLVAMALAIWLAISAGVAPRQAPHWHGPRPAVGIHGRGLPNTACLHWASSGGTSGWPKTSRCTCPPHCLIGRPPCGRHRSRGIMRKPTCSPDGTTPMQQRDRGQHSKLSAPEGARGGERCTTRAMQGQPRSQHGACRALVAVVVPCTWGRT